MVQIHRRTGCGLRAWLCWYCVGADERFDGWSYQNSNAQFCYMPSSPCDNNHRVTN